MRWIAKTSVVMAVGLGALVAGHEAFAYATTAPRFSLRKISFEPTAHIETKTLERLLDLHPNVNIWTIDENSLRNKVLAHPWIKEAEVHRIVPDTLRIEIEEQVAVAAVLVDDLYLIGPEGRPFKRAENGESQGLPFISGILPEQLSEASEGECLPLKNMIAAIDKYQAQQRPKLSEMHRSSDGSITMYVGDLPTQVELGRMDFAGAIIRFDQLRATLGGIVDRLSVVHLDARSRGDGGFRVTAQFAHQQDEQELFFGKTIESQSNPSIPMLTNRERRISARNHYKAQQS